MAGWGGRRVEESRMVAWRAGGPRVATSVCAAKPHSQHEKAEDQRLMAVVRLELLLSLFTVLGLREVWCHPLWGWVKCHPLWGWVFCPQFVAHVSVTHRGNPDP